MTLVTLVTIIVCAALFYGISTNGARAARHSTYRRLREMYPDKDIRPVPDSHISQTGCFVTVVLFILPALLTLAWMATRGVAP